MKQYYKDTLRTQERQSPDDRTLRGSERKAARFHFNLKNKDNLLDKERSSCRENTMKFRVLEQEDFGIPSFDTGNSRTHAESHLTQGVPRQTPCHDGEDSLLKAVSSATLQASKAAKEDRQHHLQATLPLDDATASRFPSPPLLDNEHKPLSSPSQTRTSLRSHLRSRTGSGKERFRVSFSESPSLDLPRGERETGRKLDILDLGRDVSPTRCVTLTDSRKNNQSELPNRDLRLDSYEHQYVPCSTNYRELLKKLHNERKVVDDLCNYTSRSANEYLTSTRSSCGQFLGPHLETESSPGRSWKLSSDAKSKSPFLPLAHSVSANFEDFMSKHGPSPSEVPLENSPPVSSLTSGARKGQEPSTCQSHSPLNFKHTTSQHSPVTPKPCFQDSGMKYRYNERSNLHTHAEEPVSDEKSSLVVVVLHQLLDLVDRYWTGSGSLLLNKEFLALARDLLAQLTTLAPSQQDVNPASIATSGLSSAGINYRIQSKLSQHSNRIGRQQKEAENQVPSFKEQDLEAGATFHASPHRASSLSYDELLNRNEVLSNQVEVLSLELKELKKQQETISLLRESQRSLVSTNNFLLQQLTREHSPSSGKAGLLSGKMATAGSASFCEKLAHQHLTQTRCAAQSSSDRTSPC